MAAKITAPYPGTLVVSGDYIIRLIAVDPTTGATITGVKVTNVNVDGESHNVTDPGIIETGRLFLVPGPQTVTEPQAEAAT